MDADQPEPRSGFFKDAVLDALSRRCNVAQFVSFDPDLDQRFSRVRGRSPNERFATVDAAVAALLAQAPDRAVNVRSFHPDDAQGRDFVYGLSTVDDVTSTLRRLASQGLHTIVNETVDVNDGGVSGVLHGDLLEFSPGDTPRCVERAGTTRVSRAFGQQLLETIYGFGPEIHFAPEDRVEFSIHPVRRGVRDETTIIWEAEELAPPATLEAPYPRWPSRFSRHVGDKAFGLVVADLLGERVPATTVVPRCLPPFRLGRPTGTRETWIRTCPTEQVPGKFTTRRGWIDPFWLLEREDPEGTMLAGVIAQEGIDADYSGALVTLMSGEPLVEGVRGVGERFMLGEVAPELLPVEVLTAVRRAFVRLSELLGPVRFEWVWDGHDVWIVQLHRERSSSTADEIYAGEPARFRRFEASRGLSELRREVELALAAGEGIVLVGDIGLSSHMCDVLRKAAVPSRLERLHPVAHHA